MSSVKIPQRCQSTKITVTKRVIYYSNYNQILSCQIEDLTTAIVLNFEIYSVIEWW